MDGVYFYRIKIAKEAEEREMEGFMEVVGQ